MQNPKTKLLILLAAVFSLTGCSLPEIKTAEFKTDQKVVLNRVKDIKDFEEANVAVSATSFDGKTTQYLTLTLINGKDMPDSESELKEIGKEALNTVVSSIANQQDYERFSVKFIQQNSVGLLNTKTGRSFSYSFKDLQE